MTSSIRQKNNLVDIQKQDNQTETEYDAFISYRRSVKQDTLVAKYLHQALEKYKFPKSLNPILNRNRQIRVFKDDEELVASNSLSDSLKTALAKSHYLIVICSRETPKSYWIQEEIKLFQQLGKADKILILLIDGALKTSVPSIFLEGLQTPGRRSFDPPVVADISSPPFVWRKARRLLKAREIFRLLAPILGCELDDLRQRHNLRRKKRFLIGFISSSLVLFFIFILAFQLYYEKKNKEIALRKVAKQEVIAQNAKIAEEEAMRKKAEAELQAEEAKRNQAEADLEAEKAKRDQAVAELKAERAKRNRGEYVMRYLQQNNEILEDYTALHILMGDIPSTVSYLAKLLKGSPDTSKIAQRLLFGYWMQSLVDLELIFETLESDTIFEWRGIKYYYRPKQKPILLGDMNIECWGVSQDNNILFVGYNTSSLNIYSLCGKPNKFSSPLHFGWIKQIIETKFEDIFLILSWDPTRTLGVSQSHIDLIDFVSGKRISESEFQDKDNKSFFGRGAFYIEEDEVYSLSEIIDEVVRDTNFIKRSVKTKKDFELLDLTRNTDENPMILDFPINKEENELWAELDTTSNLYKRILREKPLYITEVTVEAEDDHFYYSDDSKLSIIETRLDLEENNPLNINAYEVKFEGIFGYDQVIHFYNKSYFIISEWGDNAGIYGNVLKIQNEKLTGQSSYGKLIDTDRVEEFLKFSPMGDLLFISDQKSDYYNSNTFDVINLNNLKFFDIDSLPHGQGPQSNALTFSHDSKHLVVRAESGNLWTYKIDKKTSRLELLDIFSFPDVLAGMKIIEIALVDDYILFLFSDLIEEIEEYEICAVNFNDGLFRWRMPLELGEAVGIKVNPTGNSFIVYSNEEVQLFSTYFGLPLSKIYDAEIKKIDLLENGSIILQDSSNCIFVRSAPNLQNIQYLIDRITMFTGISSVDGMSKCKILPVVDLRNIKSE